MIITCQNCNKKFDINQNLIPKKGRLLQCSSCNHKWFFKSDTVIETVETQSNPNFEIFDSVKPQENNQINIDNSADIPNKSNTIEEKTVKKIELKKSKTKIFLNLTIVFMISFVALVILLDTFKTPLSKIVPNLEFLLYNLYEVIKDSLLFVKDLI